MNEEWRDVPGYVGRYQVSDQGRVRSTGVRIAGRVLRAATRKRDGYQCLALHKDGLQKTVKVHRLVALAFLPNPLNLPAVDHRDGIRHNNIRTNLRWASTSRNSLDRHKAHGAVPVLGASRSNSKANPYRSNITIHGRQKHLGTFPTPEAASAARAEALKEFQHV